MTSRQYPGEKSMDCLPRPPLQFGHFPFGIVFTILVHFFPCACHPYSVHCPPHGQHLGLGRRSEEPSPSWGKEGKQLQALLQAFIWFCWLWETTPLLVRDSTWGWPTALSSNRNKELFFDPGVPSAVTLFSTQGRLLTWHERVPSSVVPWQ